MASLGWTSRTKGFKETVVEKLDELEARANKFEKRLKELEEALRKAKRITFSMPGPY